MKPLHDQQSPSPPPRWRQTRCPLLKLVDDRRRGQQRHGKCHKAPDDLATAMARTGDAEGEQITMSAVEPGDEQIHRAADHQPGEP
jgi:hypothetical protein